MSENRQVWNMCVCIMFPWWWLWQTFNMFNSSRHNIFLVYRKEKLTPYYPSYTHITHHTHNSSIMHTYHPSCIHITHHAYVPPIMHTYHPSCIHIIHHSYISPIMHTYHPSCIHITHHAYISPTYMKLVINNFCRKDSPTNWVDIHWADENTNYTYILLQTRFKRTGFSITNSKTWPRVGCRVFLTEKTNDNYFLSGKFLPADLSCGFKALTSQSVSGDLHI